MFYLPIAEKTKKIIVPSFIQGMLDDPSCKIIIAFSGGKDSVAMVLYLLFDLMIPKERIELHHHDVDGHGGNLFDWACTPSYCQSFADAFELPIIFSWRTGGIKREILRTEEGLQSVCFDNGSIVELESRKGSSTRHKFPAVSADLRTRWCSSVAKIDVLSRVINNTISDGKVLVLTGERRQESTNRSKYAEFEKYRSHTKKRDAWQWRPVIDFTENQVWDIYRKHKVQPHPCYMLGWSRCSCQTCIFSSPNTWASIEQISPEKIEELDALETLIGHTIYTQKISGFRKPQPMSILEKTMKGTSFITAENLERWGKESTSTFVSPILLDEWVEPAGAFCEEKTGSL